MMADNMSESDISKATGEITPTESSVVVSSEISSQYSEINLKKAAAHET